MNLFQVVGDVLDLLQEMSAQLASHTHGPTPVPSNAAAFSADGARASALAAKLTPITLQ